MWKGGAHDQLRHTVDSTDGLSCVFVGLEFLLANLKCGVDTILFGRDVQPFQTSCVFLVGNATYESRVEFERSDRGGTEQPFVLRLISCCERWRPVLNGLFCCLRAPGRWTILLSPVGDIRTSLSRNEQCSVVHLLREETNFVRSGLAEMQRSRFRTNVRRSISFRRKRFAKKCTCSRSKQVSFARISLYRGQHMVDLRSCRVRPSNGALFVSPQG